MFLLERRGWFFVYLEDLFKAVNTGYQDSSGNVTAHGTGWGHGAHRHHHFYFQVSSITTTMGIISSPKGAFSFQFHKFKNYCQISVPQVQNSDESQERQKVFFHNEDQRLTSIVTTSGQFFQVIGSFNRTTAGKLSFINFWQGLAQGNYRLAEPWPWLGLGCPLNSSFLQKAGF